MKTVLGLVKYLVGEWGWALADLLVLASKNFAWLN